MIIEYHKPTNVSEALKLLRRTNPKTVPLGGGTKLSQYSGEPLAVVNLEALQLSKIWIENNILHIGSMATIQDLIDSELIDNKIREACDLDTSHNLRQMATIGGCCASDMQGSLLLGMLMAGDAELVFEPNSTRIKINEWLTKFIEKKPEGFISEIILDRRQRFAFEKISRTPKSPPMIFVCGCLLGTGKIKLVFYHETNKRLMELTDVKNINNPELLEYAYSHNLSNNNSIYFLKVLQVLVRRVMNDLKED